MFSGIRETSATTIAAAATLLIGFLSRPAADAQIAVWWCAGGWVLGRYPPLTQDNRGGLLGLQPSQFYIRCAMQPFAIAPSILSAVPRRRRVDNVPDRWRDIVHFGQMDNHYVLSNPNHPFDGLHGAAQIRHRARVQACA
jgi:hypothetical protein